MKELGIVDTTQPKDNDFIVDQETGIIGKNDTNSGSNQTDTTGGTKTPTGDTDQKSGNNTSTVKPETHTNVDEGQVTVPQSSGQQSDEGSGSNWVSILIATLAVVFLIPWIVIAIV